LFLSAADIAIRLSAAALDSRLPLVEMVTFCALEPPLRIPESYPPPCQSPKKSAPTETINAALENHNRLMLFTIKPFQKHPKPQKKKQHHKQHASALG
jgi:hypothetical protein